MGLISAWNTLVEGADHAKYARSNFNLVLGNLLYLLDAKGGHGALAAEVDEVDVSDVGSILLASLTLDRIGWWALDLSGGVRVSVYDRSNGCEFQAALCDDADIGESRENVLFYGPRNSAGGTYGADAEIECYARVLLEVTTGSKTVSAWCIKWPGLFGSGGAPLSLCSGIFTAQYLGKAV